MTFEELGEIRREFKFGRANLVAGIVIGFSMVSGGCIGAYFLIRIVIDSGRVLPLWTENGQKGWCWVAVGLLGAALVALISFGVLVVRWIMWGFTLRIGVGQHGLAITDEGGIHMVFWEEIESIQEIHHYERPPILKEPAIYLLPKVLNRNFIVRIRGREPLRLDANMKGYSTLAQMIKEETDKRSIPWQIVEEHD